MTLNPIENWINEDPDLQNLISEIESTDLSLIEKAALGFEKLCVLYKIPRMPSDIEYNEDVLDSEDEGEKRSLFEEHAYIKCLSGGIDDPRGLVLESAYHILNGYLINIAHVVKKVYGKRMPKTCLVGLKGEGFYGEVVFPEKEGKSWTELGCIKVTLFNKYEW